MAGIVLDTTWGGVTANCYVTLAEASLYIGDATNPGYKVDPLTWSSATDARKTASLLAATRDIDSQQWIGDRYSITQALEFPRMVGGSDDRWPWNQIENDQGLIMPPNQSTQYLFEQLRRVKAACCEQAFGLIRDGERNEHIERRLMGITSFSESIGPISESASYGGMVMRLLPEAMSHLFRYRIKSIPVVRK
jgi:hypothetical protein